MFAVQPQCPGQNCRESLTFGIKIWKDSWITSTVCCAAVVAKHGFNSLHAGKFFMIFLSFADFIQNWLFQNKNWEIQFFRNTIRVSNSLDPDQAGHLFCQTWSWSKLFAKVISSRQKYNKISLILTMPNSDKSYLKTVYNLIIISYFWEYTSKLLTFDRILYTLRYHTLDLWKDTLHTKIHVPYFRPLTGYSLHYDTLLETIDRILFTLRYHTLDLWQDTLYTKIPYFRPLTGHSLHYDTKLRPLTGYSLH